MSSRTPSQTVGPFFSEALRWPDGECVLPVTGERIVLSGAVLDGAGAPISDALLETWQRLPDGQALDSPSGRPPGFGRVQTGPDGSFRIETSMPGGTGTPYLEVTILARGLLKALRTRVYLAPEAEVRSDPALAAIAASPRIATLVARPAGKSQYRWDVRLQGEGETVFFAA